MVPLHRFFTKKRLRQSGKIVLAFFVLAVAVFFLVRNPLLRYVARQKIATFEERSGYTVNFQQLRFSGISGIDLQQLEVVKQADTLLVVNQLEVDLHLWKLLTGKIRLDHLVLDRGFARYNRSAGKERSDTTQQDSTKGTDAAELYNKVRRLLRLFPATFEVNDFRIGYTDSTTALWVECRKISREGEALNGTLRITENDTAQNWIVQGRMAGDNPLNVLLYGEQPIHLPLLQQKLALHIGFDTARFRFIESGTGAGGEFFLDVEAGFSGLKVYNKKLSSDTLAAGIISGTMALKGNHDFIEIDSASTFLFNAMSGNYYARYSLDREHPFYALKVRTAWVSGTDFFNSLPQGAFDDVRGIEAEGKLKYTLDFALDGLNPDAVVFSSTLQKDGFRVKRYGQTQLTRMSGDFTHQAYENEQLVRSVDVSAANPYFTPFAEVPDHLVKAILTAEDPAFFYHGGFIPEAFRESMAENYKVGAFKRGGSTISMQLVKNVFLSRKKTVFRKIEEALIVWLIEGQRLTSKERMFEVYLNIIEWGPGIYGIGEASQFYFGKRPAALTLPECIYLANIIPKPKKFRYAFDESGDLRSYMQQQSVFIMRRMATREFIGDADTTGFDPNIILRGRARSFIMPADTVVNIDSLLSIPD